MLPLYAALSISSQMPNERGEKKLQVARQPTAIQMSTTYLQREELYESKISFAHWPFEKSTKLSALCLRENPN